MREFTLVRHAAAAAAPAGDFDPPLSSSGREHAEKIGLRLAGLSYSAVWSSTQTRAIQTAEQILAIRPGIPLHLDEDLCEIDYLSACSGVADEDSLLLEVSGRVGRWVDGLRWPEGNGHLLVVAHGGPLRLLLCHLLGLPAGRHWSFHLDHGSITTVQCAPGLAILTQLNDRCHLESLHGI